MTQGQVVRPFVATQVDGTFTTSETMPPSKTLLECVVHCQSRCYCNAFQFNQVTGSCSSLDKSQLSVVDVGGKRVYIQKNSTRKIANMKEYS